LAGPRHETEDLFTQQGSAVLMASHDDHPNQTAQRAPSAPDTGEPTPPPRYDQPLEGDAFEVMRKYQVVTMPPNARLELMQMKLPEAPTELLQDTLPPNGTVAAPTARASEAGASDDAEAEFFDDSRLQETMLVPRVARRRRTHGVLVALVLGSLLALSVGASVWLSRTPSPAAVTAPVERAAPPTAPTVQIPTTESRPPAKRAADGSSGTPALPAPTPSAVKAPPASAPKATTEVKRPQPPTPQAERPQSPAPTTPPARGKQPWIDGL
jgi:hypothetical protein